MATGATAHEPMDVQVELSLESDGWGATVLSKMDALRESGHTCDMAIMATDGTMVKAHSGVLCASSSFFNRVFPDAKKTSSRALAIAIRSTFTLEVLNHVIDFLYKGRTVTRLSDIPEIKRAAVDFGISALLSLCDVYTANSMPSALTLGTWALDSGFANVQISNLGAGTTLWQNEIIFTNQLPVLDNASDIQVNQVSDNSDGNGEISNSSTTLPLKRSKGTKRVHASNAGNRDDAEKLAEKAAKRRKYKYTCDLCSRVFSTKCYMESHRATHLGERLHKCDICDKRFVQAEFLRVHMGSHLTEKPYKCDECEKSYQTIQLLKRHSKYHGESAERIKAKQRVNRCGKCGRSFGTPEMLVEHKKTHVGEKFKCELCGTELNALKNLYAHKKYSCIHRADKTLTWKTATKGKTYIRERNKYDPDETPYECQYCGRRFKLAASMTAHRKYYCPNRPDKTLKPPSMTNTKAPSVSDTDDFDNQSADKKSDQRYVCNKEGCRGKFRLPAQIKRHIRLYHGDANPINVKDLLKTVQPKAETPQQVEND